MNVQRETASTDLFFNPFALDHEFCSTLAIPSKMLHRFPLSSAVFRSLLLLVMMAIAAAPLNGVGETPTTRESELFHWPGFLPHAHSHNDYQQKRPLLDAVEARITSVEADLWFAEGKILVGHDRGKWRGEFEELYLKPLNELWRNQALPVSDGEAFLLWLDLKDGSAELRTALEQMLKRYDVTAGRDSSRVRVEVILTGDKISKETFAAQPELIPSTSRDSNFFSENDPPRTPAWRWYALSWWKIGNWDGIGPMPPKEREQLRTIVESAHVKGRKIRLWNHPATLQFWREVSAVGVDRLGTDQMPYSVARDRASSEVVP